MALGRIALVSIKGIVREITKQISGVMSVSLEGAIQNGLLSLTTYGGTEQNGTPTPDVPVDIVSNNGVLKARHQSGLPTGYTLLDSVTGDGLVGIDTGLKLQAGDEIDMDYEWLGAPSGQSSDRFFFGTQNADTSKGGCWAELYSGTGSTASWYARFSSLSSINTQTDMSTELTGHLTLKQESFKVNNVEILTPSYVGTFQDTTLTYFGRFNATGDTFVGAYLKISKFTLKNNGVYRYYGIPCKNSSNVIGMYDLVSGTFSTKVGTGTFTAGNTVSDPVEIYTDGTTETVGIKDSNNLLPVDAQPDMLYPVTVAVSSLWTVSANVNNGQKLRACEIRYYDKNRQQLDYQTMTEYSNGRMYRTLRLAPVVKYISISRKTDYATTPVTELKIEIGETMTPYFNGGTATTEMLLKVGDYQDEQEILSGAVTRNVGVKVLDGTESVTNRTTGGGIYRFSVTPPNVIVLQQYLNISSTHFVYANNNAVGSCFLYNRSAYFVPEQTINTVDKFKAWLASQYAAGTPVIVIYPLNTPTTESVAGQTMNIPSGNSTIEITQASLDDLQLSAEYKALPSN